MSKSGGGISFGTIAIAAWVLFTIFSGDDDEDTSPPVEIKVEESKPSTSIKSELKDLVNEVKKEASRIKEEFISAEIETENKEIEGTGTLIIVRPESNKEEEAIPEDQIIEKDKEPELPELEENLPDDSELTFTPL